MSTMIHNFANSIEVGPSGIILLVLIAFLFFMLIAAMLCLKAYVLWTAARRNEVGWFIAVLLVNTMGILELIYLYFVVEKWKKPTINTTTVDTDAS